MILKARIQHQIILKARIQHQMILKARIQHQMIQSLFLDHHLQIKQQTLVMHLEPFLCKIFKMKLIKIVRALKHTNRIRGSNYLF